MRVFVLYRPQWPSLRAQALQVAATSHALAARGVEVTVHYHARPGDPFAWFGLSPLPTLHWEALPVGGTAASLAIRARLLDWAERGPGVILAREKRLARWALRWLPRHPLVLEAHEVDSQVGRGTLGLEREVLAGARGLITNCEGVMHGLHRLHDLPERRAVVHNAGPEPRGSTGRGIVYAGSLLADKDPDTLAMAAASLGGITVLGPPEDPRLRALSGNHLHFAGPVAPHAMQQALAQFDVGMVTLGGGWFGRELTSPLKAFSYRSAGLRVVGAHTPAMARALPGAFTPYEVGNPDSLVAAVRRARAAPLPTATVRTWDLRAAEVYALLEAWTC